MAAVAINYFAYNFIKIHRTLRVSPAMAAGVTMRLFEVSDLVALLVESESKKPRKRRRAVERHVERPFPAEQQVLELR